MALETSPLAGVQPEWKRPGPAAEDAPADRCLARAVAGGDEAAFALFVERHHALAVRLAGRFFALRMEVEELVQDVFVKAYFAMGSFRGETPLAHWLSRIAVNACYDRLRALRRKKEEAVSQLGEGEARQWAHSADSRGEGPEESCQRREEARLAQEILARLSPPERLVLTLLVLEEKSVKEVAALTGWSVANVKIRAFRARRKLRFWLGENGGKRTEPGTGGRS